MVSKLQLLLILCLSLCGNANILYTDQVTDLTTRPWTHLVQNGDFNIYRNRMSINNFRLALGDVNLILNIPRDGYKVFIGPDIETVKNALEEYRGTYFDTSTFLSGTSNVSLPISETAYIGILSGSNYDISIWVESFNGYRIAALFLGIYLFIKAKSLVKNAVFYYTTGAFAGLLAGFLILFYIAYRFLPKKYSILPMYLGGWGFITFILNLFWSEIKNFMGTHIIYMQLYVALSVIIMMAIFYRNGPPSDIRSINLCQWTIQLVGIILIFLSSRMVEFAGTIIVLLISFYYLMGPVIDVLGAAGKVKSKLFKSPPRPRKLLTEEEYEIEGEEYTRKELEKLKSFCASPGGDAWKIISRVHEPQKLASFVYNDEDPVSYIGFREDDFDIDTSSDSTFGDSFEREQIELLKKNLRDSKKRHRQSKKRNQKEVLQDEYGIKTMNFLTDDEL
uniref:Nuclear envelope integral membrane protein 1 n=1 Tax=Rhabditophanes sp. KR3021 TaxID=114890 RepID=A0AC35TZ94_9BILA